MQANPKLPAKDELPPTKNSSFSLQTLMAATTLIVTGLAISHFSIVVSALVLLWWISPERRGLRFLAGCFAFTGLAFFLVLNVFGLGGALRSSGQRSNCLGNIREIQLAMLNHETANGKLPNNGGLSPKSAHDYSWRVDLLPYLGRPDLFEQYRFNEPWDGPNNKKLHDRMPKALSCPCHPSSSHTIYKIVTGSGTVFDETSPATSRTGPTIMLIEDSENPVCWLEPKDLTVDQAIDILNSFRKTSAAHFSDSLIGRRYQCLNIGLSDGSNRSWGKNEALVSASHFTKDADYDNRVGPSKNGFHQFDYDYRGIACGLIYFGIALLPWFKNRTVASTDASVAT